MKIILVAGARPNFMKIAPLMAAFGAADAIEPILVHTGQHYDEAMSDLFFSQLGIPAPDVDLGVGSASHAVQTAEIMKTFEPVCGDCDPDVVLVVGDVNSTIACGLVAVKLGVKLVHVEAGLRSFDRAMPEEINRVLTDAISDVLLATEPAAVENLRNEGAADEKVHLVGNVMIDTLLANQAQADESTVLDDLELAPGEYAALTLHRPANVDDPSVLAGLLDAMEVVAADMPVVFPCHPRTRKNIENLGLAERVKAIGAFRVIDPLGYLDFLKLMSAAALVLTDSGGIQEETTILKVPCLTLRNTTERPITVEVGSNRVVGTDPQQIVAAYKDFRAGQRPPMQTPDLWDGQAAQRITDILVNDLG
ncbi:MAG: non-hydrolyzing UDP-N-acetylglucosamine 2-epimerase [Planctomycetota bacterium]